MCKSNDKMLETTVIFLLFSSNLGVAYNIDDTTLKEFEENGLFGHSVALSKDSVYAGAPKGGNGTVYKCGITSSSCSKVQGM